MQSLNTLRLSGSLSVGTGFTGCMYAGPGVSFSSPNLLSTHVLWDVCPLNSQIGCSLREYMSLAYPQVGLAGFAPNA